jgi:hypothetical protein
MRSPNVVATLSCAAVLAVLSLRCSSGDSTDSSATSSEDWHKHHDGGPSHDGGTSSGASSESGSGGIGSSGGASGDAGAGAGHDAASAGDSAPNDAAADARAIDATADAPATDATADAPATDATADAPATDAAPTTPGWSLVAIDTPLRTYLDYVDVAPSGAWTPEANGWPILAQWEKQTTRTGMRFQSFTPGTTLSPAQVIALLPRVAPAARFVDITAPPYSAPVAPADATSAIQAALNAAGSMATPTSPVDVRVPAGTFDHSGVLNVPQDVRLRRWPEGSGGTLVATNPAQSAIHLAGDRSGALFLVLTSPSSSTRLTTPQATGIWVGGTSPTAPKVHDTLVIGNEVATPACAHVFAIGDQGGLWAFNYAHDGFADTFHHTGGSSFCQVVANRAQTSATRGDDLYAFVGYANEPDPVHHSTCIANWGRDGTARGLSAVGAGFISFQSNDIARTQAAGVYLAQEDGYATYGSFDLRVVGNTIAYANLNSSHDGLLAYSDSPASSNASTTFGTVPHRIERLTIQGNAISDTAPAIGNGFGIEIRSSVDTGDVSGNTLTHNRAPQIVIGGTNFTQSQNTVQ